MDAATLRWIIIVIGVVILAAIFLFGNPERKRKPRASRRKPLPDAMRLEPTLDAGPEPAVDAGDAPQGQGELPIGPQAPVPAEPRRPRPPRKPAGPPPERIVTLFLLARDNHVINGAELLQAAIKTGLEFGEMDIFHRLAEGSDQPVFSFANALKPGHFERESWNTFETKALAVFMALPGPVLALDAWDAMLATARRLAEILNAEIQDEEHAALTRQAEGRIREAMRAYDRERARKSLS
jgi:cell division protein ZipA